MNLKGSSIERLLVNFKSAFTEPSLKNFVELAEGWILCQGRHNISKVIQFIPKGRGSNHSRYYNFFSRARWEPDDLSMHLVPIVLELIPNEMDVHASVDDTLTYRSGAHIWGAGMHYDALRSTYGPRVTRVVSLAFGHNWVIVSLLVPMPWNQSRLLAVPVLFRLYRSKSTCPARDYRKRSELAADLVELLCRWLPSSRRLRLLGDVVHIYRGEVEILTKTQVGLWYGVTGSCPVRMVVTRDPKGRIDDRAYFMTEATVTVEQVIVSYSHRWSQECLHRNLKQSFGLDDPQNGWWRHPGGQRRDDRRPGPAPHESRGAKAATRTVPFVLVVYATVEIWYLTHGHPTHDVERARSRAPWNVKKREPSFADMLAASRREILFPGIFDRTASQTGTVEIDLDLVELLLAA